MVLDLCAQLILVNKPNQNYDLKICQEDYSSLYHYLVVINYFSLDVIPRPSKKNYEQDA